MKRNIFVLVCIVLLGGCAQMQQQVSPSRDIPEPGAARYILSCLHDIADMETEEFLVDFKIAEERLQSGDDDDKLYFVCLSLHAKADYKQFRHGTKVLDQYIAEHKYDPDDILGFQILLARLDEEIMTKWSAWKSLLEDKRDLAAKVESLQQKHAQDQALIEELQQQIEQLKNIEKIIKSRETGQP